MNATLDGRMVQVTRDATPQTTITALRGWPLLTRETQPENGSTPSRATAKTRREAAMMAIAVFYSMSVMKKKHAWMVKSLTSHKAKTQMMFMKI